MHSVLSEQFEDFFILNRTVDMATSQNSRWALNYKMIEVHPKNNCDKFGSYRFPCLGEVDI